MDEAIPQHGHTAVCPDVSIAAEDSGYQPYDRIHFWIANSCMGRRDSPVSTLVLAVAILRV